MGGGVVVVVGISMGGLEEVGWLMNVAIASPRVTRGDSEKTKAMKANMMTLTAFMMIMIAMIGTENSRAHCSFARRLRQWSIGVP